MKLVMIDEDMKLWRKKTVGGRAGSAVGLHSIRSLVGGPCFSVVINTKWCSHPFTFSKKLFCQGEYAFVNRSNKLFCYVTRSIHRIVENYSRLGLDAVLLGNLLLTFLWSLLRSVFRKSISLVITGYSFPLLCTPPYRVTYCS
jgi:hypothetical protein